MIGAFKYKDNTSFDFDLICKSVKRPLLPKLKSNIVQIPGSSKIYDASEGFYELMTVTIKIQYLAADFYELRTRGRSIAAWLQNGKWGRLYIVGDPGNVMNEDRTATFSSYYIAKVEDEIELTTMEVQPYGEADIQFTCLPFLYGPGHEYVPNTDSYLQLG
jgi:phage-related protein